MQSESGIKSFKESMPKMRPLGTLHSCIAKSAGLGNPPLTYWKNKKVERHIQLPSCQRPQKGCTVFSEDQETVARTDGWCRHTDSVRSGPSEPQEPECALGLPSLRSLKPWGEKVTAQKETWRFGDSVAGTRKEERPKEFSFLNTINHAQIPPKVISNHFKI